MNQNIIIEAKIRLDRNCKFKLYFSTLHAYVSYNVNKLYKFGFDSMLHSVTVTLI